jgi:hypothetical protein
LLIQTALFVLTSIGWKFHDRDRLFFCRRKPAADLPHKREKIAYTPVVGDLAILYAHYIDGLEPPLVL